MALSGTGGGWSGAWAAPEEGSESCAGSGAVPMEAGLKMGWGLWFEVLGGVRRGGTGGSEEEEEDFGGTATCPFLAAAGGSARSGRIGGC